MASGRVSVAYHRGVSWALVGRLLRDDGPLGRSLAVVVLVAAWVATWRPQVDPDAWWHLAIGESITATGSIPTIEPFSWLTAGDRFVAHSWLWDVLMVGSWRFAGATGTSLLVLPVTAAVLWLIWRLTSTAGATANTPGLPPLGRALLVLLAVVVTLPVWAPRAQTLDVAFVLAAVLVLAGYLRRGGLRGLLTLPVLGVLWANLHGSAILALPACVAIAVVALPVGARWGAWPSRPAWPLVATGLAGVATTVLNPSGVGLLLYPFQRDVASAFSPAIVEWRSPDFGAPELLPFRVLLAAALLVVVWSPSRARDPFLLLAAAAWTFAALGAVRFLAIAGPLLVVALAPGLATSLRRWLAVASPAAEGDDRGDGGDGGAGGATAAVSPPRDGADGAVPRPAMAVAALAVVAVLVAGWLIVDPARQDAAIARRQPLEALAAIEASGCTARLLAAYGWAGYVIWSTGHDVGAYGNSAEGAVTEQARLEAVSIDPGPWLDDHAVGVVLMSVDGPLSHWLDEADGWRLAYRDTQATVHVRADANDCPVSSPTAP
jgi:hypothetical protein